MSARWKSALLWLVAVILMLSSAVYQRLTGPTHPERGQITVDGEARRYRLLRSEESVRDARIALPAPDAEAEGTLWFRRYPTNDTFQPLAMAREELEDGTLELAAYLPAQPASGKLEYRVEVEGAGGTVRIPDAREAEAESTIVMRFKDPVPLPTLISHVFFMFFAVLIGMRAGLGALFEPGTVRRHAWTAFGLMTVGGMILGPIVQKYAFGAYWTGFPWGYDLTDNKTLVMWLVWLVACGALGWPRRAGAPGWKARATVLVAAAVMTVVYVIPHSLRGSELDYGAVDAGVPASEAVTTGG